MSNDLFVNFFSTTKFVDCNLFIQYGRGNPYVPNIIFFFYHRFCNPFEMTCDSSTGIIAIIISYGYAARGIIVVHFTFVVHIRTLYYYGIVYSRTNLIRYVRCTA